MYNVHGQNSVKGLVWIKTLRIALTEAESDRAVLQLCVSPRDMPVSSLPPAPPGYWRTAPCARADYPGCWNHSLCREGQIKMNPPFFFAVVFLSLHLQLIMFDSTSVYSVTNVKKTFLYLGVLDFTLLISFVVTLGLLVPKCITRLLLLLYRTIITMITSLPLKEKYTLNSVCQYL